MDTTQLDVLSGLWDFANSKVGLVLIGFLLTTVLGSLLAKRIERAAWEHKTRFSKLHEDRGRAIADIYNAIVEVQHNLRNMYYKYRPVGISPPSPREEDVLASIRTFRLLAEKSRIYFALELANTIDAVCGDFERAFRALESAYLFKSSENPAFEDTDFMSHFERSNKVRAILEEEFRQILGVV
jgi:hypothetical protein